MGNDRARHLLLALCNRLGDNLHAWPKMNMIMTDTEIPRSTVLKLLRYLKEQRLLYVIPVNSRANSGGRSGSLYVPNINGWLDDCTSTQEVFDRIRTVAESRSHAPLLRDGQTIGSFGENEEFSQVKSGESPGSQNETPGPSQNETPRTSHFETPRTSQNETPYIRKEHKEEHKGEHPPPPPTPPHDGRSDVSTDEEEEGRIREPDDPRRDDKDLLVENGSWDQSTKTWKLVLSSKTSTMTVAQRVDLTYRLARILSRGVPQQVAMQNLSGLDRAEIPYYAALSDSRLPTLEREIHDPEPMDDPLSVIDGQDQSLPKWCGRCHSDRRLIFPDGADPVKGSPCPDCHPSSVKRVE